MSKTNPATGPASENIDKRIADLGGWRGETLAKIRALIKAADPEVIEEWKWDNPVWSHGGIICTGEAYKAAVKTTFAKGAALPRSGWPLQFEPWRRDAAGYRFSPRRGL